jgi:hypothetical protein
MAAEFDLAMDILLEAPARARPLPASPPLARKAHTARVMRTKVSPGQLFALLSAEFAAKRPNGCEDCRMPLPYRIDRPDTVSANWRLGTPRQCPHKCHIVMAEISATFWPRFDLVDEGAPAAVPLPVEQSAPRL